MACKRYEISTFIKDNGVDLFFVTETWLSAQGDEAKTAELAPSGFDVKSFPRQSRSRGGGIATVYKSTLGSNITFKTNFDFTHTSFEVVQASITLQHNTLHFFCLYRPPPNRRNNLTDSMFTEQLPDLLDYVNSLPGFVCLVGDMNIHFDNMSLTCCIKSHHTPASLAPAHAPCLFSIDLHTVRQHLVIVHFLLLLLLYGTLFQMMLGVPHQINLV